MFQHGESEKIIFNTKAELYVLKCAKSDSAKKNDFIFRIFYFLLKKFPLNDPPRPHDYLFDKFVIPRDYTKKINFMLSLSSIQYIYLYFNLKITYKYEFCPEIVDLI